MVARESAWVLVAAILFACPTPGHTQRDERSEEFEERLAEGLEAYKQEDYERALEAYRRAEQIASPPLLQYNIARTIDKMGRCREARRRYRKVIEMENVSEDYRSKARRYLDELMEQCPPKGTLHIECGPEHARVRVEGGDQEARVCPATFELEPSTYRVTVRADGYQPVTERVEVESDERSDREFELREARSHMERHWRSYVGYGGLAVGAGLLVGGGMTDLAAAGRLERLRTAIDNSEAGRVRRIRREARRARTRTALFYGTGGVMVAGAATLLIVEWTGDGSSASAARIRPRLSSTGIGLTVRW